MNAFARLVVMAAMLVAVRAQAQEVEALRLDVVPAAKPFAKGTKVVQAAGSYTPAIRYSEDEFTTGSVGVGYYLFDNHAINVVGHGFHVSGDEADGGGVSLLGRSHLLTLDRWTFYVDGGVGYYWANEAVPEGGTTYNFASRVGLGVGFEVARDTWLTGGARYFHLSNAKVHGSEKNPGYDGIEYYVGVMWAWR